MNYSTASIRRASANFLSKLAGIGISLFCLLAVAAHAGITVSLYLDNDGNEGSPFYIMFANLSTNALSPVPDNTLFYVWSPTGSTNSGVHAQIDSTGGSSDGSGGAGYGTYDSLISEVTNQWTLMTVTGATTNLYHFSFSGFPSNDFPGFSIVYPVNNQLQVPRSPNFFWQQGPTNYTQLFVQVTDPGSHNFFNTYLPLTETNWQVPGTLTLSTNYTFSVIYNNFPTNVPASTPIDASSNTFPGWTSTEEFSTYNDAKFSPSNGLPSIGHALVAYYTFDDTNNLGADSSPWRNQIYCGTYWGTNGHVSTDDFVSGGAAVAFFGDSSITPCGRVFTNLASVLSGSFSVSLWLKTSNSVGADDDDLFQGSGQILLEMDQNTTIPVGITGSKLAFATSDGSGNLETLHSASSVNTGDYVHVVVTRDAGTGQKQIFINGALDSAQAGIPGLLAGTNVTEEEIGSDVSSPYTGLIDELQIYNGVLSAGEVATLYASPGQSAPDAPLSSPSILLAHYAFDIPANPGADSSGNGFDLNYGDGNEYYTNFSRVGSGSVYFNGNGYLSYLQTPKNLLDALARNYSISLWINTSQTAGSDGESAQDGAGIVGATLGSGYHDSIPVSLTGGAVTTETGDGDTDLASTSDINDGNWHHVVVTRDQQNNGTMKVFVDGTLQNSGTGSTALLNDPLLITIGALADASNPDPSGTSPYNGFTGYLDDIQMYNVALTADNVSFLYAHPGATLAGGASTLVAHYPFDAQTMGVFDSQFLADTSGNGYNIPNPSSFDGPYPQPVTTSIAGNTAVQFSGSNFYYLPTNLISTIAGNYTLSLWLQTTQATGLDSDQGYDAPGIFWAGGVGSDYFDSEPMTLTGSKLGFYTGANSYDTLHSATSINSGQFTHLVVTRDLASGLKQIYINGNLDAVDTADTNLLGDSTQVVLGVSLYHYGVAGIVDDVQLYSSVLTPDEIQFLHNNPGLVLSGSGTGGGSPSVDFNAALNTVGLNYTTQGNAPWGVESGVSLDGLAAQSGPISGSQSSTLQTTITGPCTVYFNWETANTGSGGFRFYAEFDLDGGYQASLNGNDFWEQSGPYYFTDHSPHTFTWIAQANGSSDSAARAYVDQIVISNVYPATVNDVLLNGTSIGLGYHPLNLLVGTNVTIANQVAGNPAPTSTWYKNGQLLVNETNATLSFTNLQYSDAGYYVFQTQNGLGSTTEEDFVINAYLPTDLRPLSVSYPAVVSSASLVPFVWSVTNTGPGYASNVQDLVNFTSPAGAPYFLQTTAVFNTQSNVNAAAAYTVSNLFRFPNVGAGTYTLLLDVNYNSAVIETTTNNNTLVGQQVTVVNPDLQPGGLMVSTATNYIGSTVTISYNTTNNGPGVIDMANGPGGFNWYDLVYLSTKPFVDADARQIAQITQRTNINVGSFVTTSLTASIFQR